MRGLGLTTVMANHLAFFFPSIVQYMSWVAIDQFFVLSGFLITTLLVREYGNTGRIDLKRFYARRVGRLYPLIVVATLIALVCAIFPVGGILETTWLAVVSIPLYFSNWAILATNDWSFLGTLSPTWSLAIEEQFYMIWPPFLIAVTALGGRIKTLIALTGAMLVAMLIYRRHIWLDWLTFASTSTDVAAIEASGNTTWNLLYVSTLARPDGILVGALLALALGYRPRRPGRRATKLIAVAGLAGFIVDILIFVHAPYARRPAFIFNWGLFVFNVGSAAMILHLLISPKSLLARFYSLRPLVWLGQRCYGIYILQFTVIMMFVNFGWTTATAGILASIITIVISDLSYRYFESPIRRAVNRRFARTSVLPAASSTST